MNLHQDDMQIHIRENHLACDASRENNVLD